MISVVVPVYESHSTLQELNRRIIESLVQIQIAFEIIYVFDGGEMRSWNELKVIKRENPSCVKIIRLSKNFGQHNAIMCGFDHCNGDYVVTLDDDLQYAPEDIKFLIEAQKKDEFDLIYGVSKNLQHSWFRNGTSIIVKFLLAKSMKGLNKNYSSFRLIKRSIVEEVAKMKSSYVFIDGYLSWTTSHVGVASITHSKREASKSSYSLSKLFFHAMNILVTFTNVPVRLMSYSAFLIFIATCFYVSYIITRIFVYNDLLPGFATIMIALGTGISFVLLGLSIVGEYLTRINSNVVNKPTYFVKEILDEQE